MKFTAYPVNEGDAFFFEYKGKRVLVDTGKKDTQCKDLLQKDSIDHIDLILITHYDKDHVGGLLSLLESNIKVDEIWLPSGFKTISDCEINCENYRDTQKNEIDYEIEQSIIKRLREREEDIVVEIELNSKYLSHSYRKGISPVFDKNCLSDCEDCYHHFPDCHYFFHKYLRHYPNFPFDEHHIERCLKYIRKMRDCLDKMENCLVGFSFFRNYGMFYPANFEYLNENKIKLTYINKKHTDLIGNICRVIEQKNIKVKWLEFTNRPDYQNVKNEYSIKLLNSIETNNPKSIIKNSRNNCQNSGLILELTQINKESLVFLFDDNDLPNILFTADSGFSFIESTIKIKNNSIVTAPHHGSTDYANVNVYPKIEGENLIFVRSDKITSTRPCNEYITKEIKYCTICNVDEIHQTISLEYKTEKWIPISDKIKQCHCKKVK